MAIRRIRRILCPGGILRLSDIAFSFNPEEIEEHIEAWCATLPLQLTSADDCHEQFMRAGGVLRLHDLIYDFQPSQAEAVFARWFGYAATDPMRGYTRDDFAEHIRTEHSTFRWLFEPMLRAAGFEIATANFDASVYGTYTCIKT